VIDEYVDEIVAVDEDDDGRFVTTANHGNFYTEDFAEKDWVLVKYGYVDGAMEITDMVKTEKLTGKLTKIVGSTYTIDGVEYKFHKGAETDLTAGKEYDFYLDSNGYIIKVGGASVTAALDKLVLFTDVRGDADWGYEGKAIYATGKTGTTDVKTNAAEYFFYSFTMDSDKVKVSENADYYSNYYYGAYDFAKGTTKIVDNGGALAANVNSNTAFVYIDAKGDTTTYTGYKTAPNFDDAQAIAVYTKKTATAASVVYVWTKGATMTDDDATLTYLVVDSYDKTTVEKDNAETSYYTVRTLAGTTVNVSPAVMTSLAATYGNFGVAVATKLTYDDGVVVGYTPKSTNIDSNLLVAGAVVKEDAGVIYAAGEGIDYASDAAIWVLDLVNNTETKISATSINKKAGTYGAWTAVLNDNGEVTTLVLKKGATAGVTAVADAAALGEALVAGGTIVLTADVSAAVDTLVLAAGATLDGGNNTVTATGATQDTSGVESVIRATGGTIKNLVADGGDRGIFAPSLAGDLTLDNVTAVNSVRSLNVDGMKADTFGTKTLAANNSTFAGWLSCSGTHVGLNTYDNCTFVVNPSLAKPTLRGNGLNPFINTELTDCTFDTGFELDLCDLHSGKTVTLTNCKVGNTVITAENLFASLVVTNDGTPLADSAALTAALAISVSNVDGSVVIAKA